ncbi:MAG: helix-turn-helix transcriptional regulator [Chloroflexi bacterium]|nr:helix-turn-helix transcriptional regulator [Chloroflexota bacterium]
MSNVRFEDWEAEQLQDPEFRRVAEELEPGYQVTRLRIQMGLTQEQLAQMVGTHQSSIARLESGRVAPRISFLRKVVNALSGKLEINISSRDDIAALNNLFVGKSEQLSGYDKVNDKTQTITQNMEVIV